eukprot:GHVR01169278.1.p1 GENE.GHVR01169278.1~~GHVR01169278.1.p1  ORF type:complete len:360 (-),score=64.60 GHVR01169278.1:1511-2590(-)
MASNTDLNLGSGGDKIVTKERTHDGDAGSKQQMVGLSGVSGTEGSYTWVDVTAGAGTAATALRTTLASDDPGVAHLATIAGDTTSIDAKDVMLGTDFSSVLGTSSLVLATQADAVANTADGVQVTSFNMVFNGTTWDRVREGTTAGSILTDDTAGNALLTTIDTDTGVIAGDTTSIDAKLVSGTVIGEVEIGAASGAAGDLAKAANAVAGASDTGVAMLAVRDDEQAAMTPIDGDYTTLRTDKFGNLKTTLLPDATSEIKYGVIDDALSGDNTLQAAAGAGIKIRVLSVFMISAGTVTARFESGAAGTALTGQMNLVVNSGFTLPFNPAGWFETADNALLNLELSAAISVDGCFTYVEV